MARRELGDLLAAHGVRRGRVEGAPGEEDTTNEARTERDPFEQAVGIQQKSAMSMGGALGAPMTAFQYDWNMLPIGQQLWLEHLLSFEKFPPLQKPGILQPQRIMEEVQKANTNHPGD